MRLHFTISYEISTADKFKKDWVVGSFDFQTLNR